MPFEDSGFLASEAPWISRIRDQYRAWFGFVSKVNKFAMSVLLRKVPKVPEELYIATLYARAVTMYQGAVLLAERGMAAESRTLVRGCAETAIALGCTRRDKLFAEKLDDDHDKHRIALANDLLNLPADDPNLSAEQRASLKQLIADVSAQYSSPRPLRINWAAASSAAGMTDLYLTVYRQTSSDASHVSLRALDRHLVTDASEKIIGFQLRPFPEETIDTLSSSIAALLHATEAKLLGLDDTDKDDAALLVLIREWGTLVEASEGSQ
jgi:Family of unknown function (DUF5677)